MKIEYTYTKDQLMEDILYEVLKRKTRRRLYRDHMPTIADIETNKQIIYIDIKGGPDISFDCILFKKEVELMGRTFRVLFEDINGNEIYLDASYISLYIRFPIWSRVYTWGCGSYCNYYI